METEVLTAALIRSMARELSVPDLVRTAETLKQSGQNEAVEILYATWLQHNVEHPLLCAVLFNYSVVLTDAGKLDAARDCLERSIGADPHFMPAYINLGRLYERQGKAGMAVIQWSAAAARLGAVNGAAISYRTTALNQCARVLEGVSEDESAEAMLQESLSCNPHQPEALQHLVALRQRQCKWPAVLPSERVSREAQMKGMSPLSAAALTDDPLFQLAMASHYNERDVGTPASTMASWPRATAAGGSLRIGYLSSDLREHAVGYLLTEVFGLHDREAVKVNGYYCGPPSEDALHARFKASVDEWTSIGALSDEDAARRIADDGIQILVDLNGYTREARLGVVARRPAPVIVNWLGFPGTMGSPYHHYIIADEWIIPPDHELYYSERVRRLPCYQPSNRQREVAPRIPSRSEVGLPDGAMVYCCFNGAHKINRFTLDRWLMILGRVPGSVLWLLSSTEPTHERLRNYAAGRGIARERLVFADKLANPLHLSRYQLADLFLDTTPYGAHTTASDALFMGVPVLTLSGRSFASRVCGSLVRAAGLPELITTTAEEFVERAVELGGSPSTLSAYGQRLRANHDSCVLFNSPLLVRKLEELYGSMWNEYLAGDLEPANLANLPAFLEIAVQQDHEELEVQSLRDYRGWWLSKLAARHRVRPMVGEPRLAAIGLDVSSGRRSVERA